MGKRHIFGDRHPFDEAEILMNECDALSPAASVGAMAIGLAVDRHGTAIGGIDAAQDLYEGRFAGAVLA